MPFADALNEYLGSLDCTNKGIAERCGISTSAISRYRKGERTPDLGGKAIDQLSSGIASLLAESDPASAPTAAEIKSAFAASIREQRERGLLLCERTDALMSLLAVKNAELASALEVDPSYLSRIRSKQRIPADQHAFARTCGQCFAARSASTGKAEKAAELVNLDGALETRALANAIAAWLLGE